jgi:hypothetical protein
MRVKPERQRAIQFFETHEDAVVILDAANGTLDFIALLFECPVMAPRVERLGCRGTTDHVVWD